MDLPDPALIDALSRLGDDILQQPSFLEDAMARTYAENKWFTESSVRQSLHAVAENYLQPDLLYRWAAAYDRPPGSIDRKVGVVSAGNVPLVGFHDVLSVLVSGHELLLKQASKDTHLLPCLLGRLGEYHPSISSKVRIVELLKGFEAVIATGSNNSSRYFEYYFRQVPHIIRKNRNSAAVLTGEESEADLAALGHDVFDHFGLGCRSVSKLYLPVDYDLSRLHHAFSGWSGITDHHLYKNNLDYNRTILLMNSIPFEDVDFINITQNPMIASPIANLHFQFYDDVDMVQQELETEADLVQCIVGSVRPPCTVNFGDSQQPGLADYADKVDTMQFLCGL